MFGVASGAVWILVAIAGIEDYKAVKEAVKK
jgi:hypothetical protein